MKKVLALALSLTSLSAVFAQSGNKNSWDKDNKDYRYEAPKKQDSRNDQYAKVNYPQKDQKDYRNMSDRERRAEIDRINKDYDRQIMVYKNDRRMSAKDRDYRIKSLENERNSKLKAFGGGLLLGGILGAILSN